VEVCENTIRGHHEKSGNSGQKTKKKVHPKNHRQTSTSNRGVQNKLDRVFGRDAAQRKWRWTSRTSRPMKVGCTGGCDGLCSRKMSGCPMADHMRVDWCAMRCQMAITRRCPRRRIIASQRRGVQYGERMMNMHLLQCMGWIQHERKGDCWDNAAMESLLSTLKTETGPHRESTRRMKIAPSVDSSKYIEVFYNRQPITQFIRLRQPRTFGGRSKN